MGLIYMRISPSGGKYIGKTTQKESTRWSDHKKEANDITDNNYNSILNRAIRKYGAENFKVEILEDNIPENLLDEREAYWINYYQTYYLNNQHGYNMTHGGDGRRKYDEKEIIQLWSSGLSISDTALQLGIDSRTVASYLENYGISSEEISQQGEKARTQKRSIQINQYTLDGIFIKTWPSMSEIYKEKGISTTLIGKVCNHENNCKKAGGFIWTYANDPIDIKTLVSEANSNIQGRKKVRCIETGEIFNTVTEAASFYKKDRHTIADACKNGNIVRTIKLHFEYVKETK